MSPKFFRITNSEQLSLYIFVPNIIYRNTGVNRDMKVSGAVLRVTVTSSELRLLRVSVGSLLDLIKLSCDTMEMFDAKS